MAIRAGQNSQEEGAGGAEHEPVGSEPDSVAEKDDVWLDLVGVERSLVWSLTQFCSVGF